jgi:hypothetical protein
MMTGTTEITGEDAADPDHQGQAAEATDAVTPERTIDSFQVQIFQNVRNPIIYFFVNF